MHKSKVAEDWKKLNCFKDLSPRDRLEKLVKMHAGPANNPGSIVKHQEQVQEGFFCKEYFYFQQTFFGPVRFSQWREVDPDNLSIVTGDTSCRDINPESIAFFDTETTGLSGGAGTIPFVLGVGFLEENGFRVKVFVLLDPAAEGEMLAAFDDFLAVKKFAAVVTYNGRCFDFPLMENRYILLRRRFPWSNTFHLDFLYAARTIWKNTYESRSLSFLGERLLGLSRDEDVPGAQIPALYNLFLRRGDPGLLTQVIEHNALDLVGLSALLLLACRYLAEPGLAYDPGEIFGLAVLLEKAGRQDRALKVYRELTTAGTSSELKIRIERRHSRLLKSMRLYEEACAVWRNLGRLADPIAWQELSVHYEHRDRDYRQALQVVTEALSVFSLSESQREQMEKRLARLYKKVKRLEAEDEDKL